MKLSILGSSSKGNAYILHNESTALVIEAGVVLSELRKALDWNISKIVGCIATHIHSDHFGKAHEYIKAGIDVYASKETIELSGLNHHRLQIIKAGEKFSLGEFTILPFETIHDAPGSLGFLINHAETGNILFLTDSYFSEYKFANLNNILVEANYDEEILEANVSSGRLNNSVRHRIITSHMGIGTCLDLLSANDLSKVNKIILLHLSDWNSNAIDFRDKVKMQTGCDVVVADAGMEVEFNKTPF